MSGARQVARSLASGRLLAYGLAGCAALWAVGIAVAVVSLVFRHNDVVPFWDQWYEVTPAQHVAHFFWRNAEHVIALPRLVYMLDDAVGHGTNYINVAVTFAIQAIQAGLLLWLHGRAQGPSRSRAPSLAAGAMIVAALFAPVQWENFVWGFQVQFVLVYLLAAATFALCAAAASTWRTDVAIGTLCVAAGATMANGAFVAPIAFVLSRVVRPHDPRRSWIIVAGWTFSWLLIAVSQLFPSTSGSFKAPLSLDRPGAVLAFLGSLLGSPFEGEGSVRAATGVGFGGLAILVLLLLLTARGFTGSDRSQRGSPVAARAALSAVAVFAVASLGVIAVGRVFQGPSQAFASRYATPAVLCWLSMALAWAGPLRGGIGTALTILLSFGACWASATGFGLARWVLQDRTASLKQTETSMLAGVPDWVAYAAAGPKSWLSIPQAAHLRADGLSVFAEPWSKWIGSPAAEHLRIDAGGLRCDGAISGLSRISDDGWRLAGWSARSRKLLLVDGKGIIVGYGLAEDDLSDAAAAGRPDGAPSRGWVAHAHAPTGTAVSALALRPGTRDACVIAGTAALNDPVTARSQAGSVALPVQVSLSGSWQRAEQDLAARPGFPPGPVFDSRLGGDAGLGRLVFTFHLPAHASAVELPVTTGPSAQHMGVILRDAGTGEEIDEMGVPGGDRWQKLSIGVPHPYADARQGTDVALEVQDLGAGWGQWMAVGVPEVRVSGADP